MIELNRRSLFWPSLALTAGILAASILLGCGVHAERVASARVAGPPAAEQGPGTGLCYDCFWQYQPQGFRDELARWYESHPSSDPLLDADRRYMLARIEKDRKALCSARRAFEALRPSVSDPSRKLMLEETLAFTAQECGGGAGKSFRRAAAAAEAAGQMFKAVVYDDLADRKFKPEFGEVEIKRHMAVPSGATGYILGESAIRVSPGERVGVQVERTVRDWLSYQFAWDFSERRPSRDELLTWHEGARLRDVMQATPAEIVPLSGTLVARREGRWFAPDETGVFRFEVIPDKVEYPTTRVYEDVALLADTHGIASLVASAVRRRVPLVVGCCDTPYKAQAAWWLASRGVNVYFPCDRQVGNLLGYEGTGILVGSAPVRALDGGAVIGDRPIRFSTSERVVVEDAKLAGSFQYYDAAARYFRRLGEMLPLDLDFVQITGPGESAQIVQRADETGAKAIALRVWNEDDARPVRAWLAASPEHRAVLFHTAPYAPGYALFQEFPEQTTFGDPRPRFLTEPPGAIAQRFDR